MGASADILTIPVELRRTIADIAHREFRLATVREVVQEKARVRDEIVHEQQRLLDRDRRDVGRSHPPTALWANVVCDDDDVE